MKNLLSLLLLCCLFATCKSDDDTGTGGNTEPILTPISDVSGTNVLLIIADDIGIEGIPFYDIGAIKPSMPHVENLAANGLVFDQAWSFPVCAPTRSSIITGRYGFRTGVLNASTEAILPTTEQSLQSFLDEYTNEAYSNAVFGKWHLSGNNANGPAELGVYHAGPLSGGVSDFYNWNLTENGNTSNSQEYITSKLTDMASDWINEQEKPWFCWMAYTSAHTPLHVPPAGTHSQGDLPTDEASIEANPMPYFMAMLENLDYEIGRLMENIPADELANTTIIFIGDNGTSRNVIQSPYGINQSKGSLFQGGVHVPLVVSGKDVSRVGQRESSLVSSTDLFATIAEIAGFDLDLHEDSHSFYPLLSNANTGIRKYNYAEVFAESFSTDPDNKSGHTIRNERYKLIKLDNGTQRFYDLENDPYENSNLLNGNLNSSESEVFQELEEKLVEIKED